MSAPLNILDIVPGMLLRFARVDHEEHQDLVGVVVVVRRVERDADPLVYVDWLPGDERRFGGVKPHGWYAYRFDRVEPGFLPNYKPPKIINLEIK